MTDTASQCGAAAAQAEAAMFAPEVHAANIAIVRAKYDGSPLMPLIEQALFGEYDNTEVVAANRTTTGRARSHMLTGQHVRTRAAVLR